jgi:hypothetical protein
VFEKGYKLIPAECEDKGDRIRVRVLAPSGDWARWFTWFACMPTGQERETCASLDFLMIEEANADN